MSLLVFAFWFRNWGAEEVQEHALPSACRRTTVLFVQGHRFVGVRGSRDHCPVTVTFLEEDHENTQLRKFLSLRSITSSESHDFVDGSDNGDLNIHKLFSFTIKTFQQTLTIFIRFLPELLSPS